MVVQPKLQNFMIDEKQIDPQASEVHEEVTPETEILEETANVLDF